MYTWTVWWQSKGYMSVQPVTLNDYSMQRALNIDLYVDSDDKAIKVT